MISTPSPRCAHPIALRLRACVAAACLLAPALAHAEGQVQVRDEVSVSDPELTLGDIATFAGLSHERVEVLAALELGPAPTAGDRGVIPGTRVLEQIRAVDPTVAVHVPDEIRIRLSERSIDPELVRDRLARAVRARMPWRPDDVTFVSWGLPAPFRVPATATRVIVRFDPRETFSGRVTAQLEWVDPDSQTPTHTTGAVRRSASVVLRVTRPVVVAKVRLGRGAVISSDAVGVETRSERRLPDDALREVDGVIGQRLRVMVRPGSPILASYLDSEPLIARGDLVAVNAGGGALDVQLMARALAEGRLGDIIKLQNPSSRETFPGRVTGPRTAELALPGAGVGTGR